MFDKNYTLSTRPNVISGGGDEDIAASRGGVGGGHSIGRDQGVGADISGIKRPNNFKEKEQVQNLDSGGPTKLETIDQNVAVLFVNCTDEEVLNFEKLIQ